MKRIERWFVLLLVGCVEIKGDVIIRAEESAGGHDPNCTETSSCVTSPATGDTSATISTPPQQEPEAAIDSPAPLSSFVLGQPVPLEGSVSDPQQPPDTLAVQWRIREEITGSLIAFVDVVPDTDGRIANEWVALASGTLLIELVVSDEDGNEALDQVSIVIIIDTDGDGYAEGAADCNDLDPTVYLGAEELCDGAIDQDCNGIVDDRDIDADGHFDLACTGYYGPGRDDCDDTNPLIYPGMTESCDGFDGDCDGIIDNFPVDGVIVYIDADGDGWGGETPYPVCEVGAGETEASGDCAELDAEIHPGAVEICGTGRDEDCDTFPTPCTFEGIFTSSDFAAKLNGTAFFTDVDVGDFNGDGVREVVAASGYSNSNNGRVYVVEPPSGTLSVETSSLDIELTGRWADEGFGDAVSVADVDLDGDDDLLIGGTFAGASASYLGGAYLFRGPLIPGTYSDAAYLQIYGAATLDQLGHDLTFISDQTGDGLPDLLIGAEGSSPDGIFAAGEAYVFDGASSGVLSATDATSTLQGATINARVGTRVLDAGDVDGDGQADLLIGAEGMQVGGLSAGGAYLVHGPAPALIELDQDADARIEGTALSSAGRAAAAGDLDGDGYSDVVVGAPNHGNGPSLWMEGFACVLRGPVPPVIALASGSLCVYGGANDEHTGGTLALGDLQQDGQPDLIVDFQYGSVLGAFDGALTGTYGPADVFLTVQGDTYGDHLFALLTDLDSDSANDIVMSGGTSVWMGLSNAL